jgi:hypothetical protein
VIDRRERKGAKGEDAATPGRMERSLLGGKPRVFARKHARPGANVRHPFGVKNFREIR